jgi:hypothetical protein
VLASAPDRDEAVARGRASSAARTSSSGDAYPYGLRLLLDGIEAGAYR